MLLDSALIDPELGGQIIDGNALGVASDQVLHPSRLESPADTPWGSSRGRLGPRWDHFEEVPDTSSLVRMVQVMLHYRHRV